MRDVIVKLLKLGLPKIQSSTDNTLVLRKDELDKSVLFSMSPYLYEQAFLCHILTKKTLQNNQLPFMCRIFVSIYY